MSKKLEIKQRRRAEAEQREAERRAAARRRNLVTSLIAIVVLIAVGLVVFFSREEPAESIGGSVAEAGCDEIQTFPEAQGDDVRGHVDNGTDVDYDTDPPTYGPHYGTPAAPGFYSEPVEEETLVHNLEHGQIVILFDPDASQETKDEIEEVAKQEPQATVASPRDGLDRPVYFTAWGAYQACDKITQEAIDAFRKRFQGRGPENVGVPTFNG